MNKPITRSNFVNGISALALIAAMTCPAHASSLGTVKTSPISDHPPSINGLRNVFNHNGKAILLAVDFNKFERTYNQDLIDITLD